MTPRFPHFVPVADHALLVELGEEVSERLSQQVLALDHAIAATPPLGVQEVVPALVNLLVEFDPLVTDHDALQASLVDLLQTVANIRIPVTTHQVDICYDSDLSPDLNAVASTLDVSIDTVINAHLGSKFRVGMYGFAPGYAYLTGLDPMLNLPRKSTALRDVPAGSVIIAGPQCLVTTLTMPTGWSILGRSPTQILRHSEDHPFLFNVGDHVRFNRIDRATYEAHLRGEASHG
ncbi:5-oxoprolinase subunit B family protein [Aliiroseovarius crassostreae]|uniref:5-oxoprolinase subunit B family protein n=1 Tax=Aliiroseovarius crassostreae TaxID=154981 RepID=UPI00220E978A|nr:allophanate hydrolase subunit 1 [Aliiroseovarius crassostreae]UWP87923.1 allophanate hydrolase subunit 1 [Aliiroseovarius crassostreae]UWQ00542.1 allophanate hydrolase subunit 1 [Aliiroseovarius crassostreae]